MCLDYTLLISNTFRSNARLKLAKKLTNAKQHPEAEFLLFEIYSRSACMLSFKINRHILKNKQKNKSVCIHGIIRLIIMNMKIKTKKDHIDTT